MLLMYLEEWGHGKIQIYLLSEMLGFKKNIGLIDRILRVIVGIGAIYWTSHAVASFGWSLFLILLGIYLLITGIIGRSPFYTFLGMHSDERVH